MEFFFKENVSNKKIDDGVYFLQHYFSFGNKKRIATVTDVKFINENKLIVAHRAAAKLYLVEISKNSINILETLILKINGEYFHPDLIAIKENNIYTPDFYRNLHP